MCSVSCPSASSLPGLRHCLAPCDDGLILRSGTPIPRPGAPAHMPHIMPNPRWGVNARAGPSRLQNGTGVFSSGTQTSHQPSAAGQAPKQPAQPPTHASRYIIMLGGSPYMAGLSRFGARSGSRCSLLIGTSKYGLSMFAWTAEWLRQMQVWMWLYA